MPKTISTRFLTLAFRNLKSYWKQSLAAIVSVVAGFTAFVLFEGYLQNIYTVYKDFNTHVEMYGDVIIEKKGAFEVEGRAEPWDYSLSADDQIFIESQLANKSSSIKVYSRFLPITGSLDTPTSSSSFQGLAYDITKAAELRGPWKWDTYWGKPLQVAENSELKMILGLRLAQKIGCLPDQLPPLKKYSIDLIKRPQYRPHLCESQEFQLSAMTESGQVNALDLTVSGIQDKGFIDRDSRYIAMSLSTAQKLFNTNKVSYYGVKFESGFNPTQLIKEFNTNSSSRHITMTPWKDHHFGVLYKKTLSLLDIIRNFLISIIVFVGAMSVFNTLIKLVKERTSEIGMLRSLGFQPQQIRTLFYFESFFLSSFGCLIGSLVSIVLSLIINQLEITYPSGQFSTETELIIQISGLSYLYGFFLMNGISLFACFIAVRKPSQSNIAHLLIYT